MSEPVGPPPIASTRLSFNYQQTVADLDRYRRSYLCDLLVAAYERMHKDRYEWLLILSLTSSLAIQAGYPVGLALVAEEETPAPQCRYAVVLDLPAGQVSILIEDSALPLFPFLPPYQGVFYGLSSKDEVIDRFLQPGCSSLLGGQTTRIPVVYAPSSSPASSSTSDPARGHRTLRSYS